ncbi:hypothetical protein [Lentzea sp. NBRC 102530]|uniref:hypothetical protein n=1 Tax=Lentzea sp. NBRC 102530 TaxID=3032201 RepID=UPI0024A38D6D|nr:hypothetical protein [Lentzea sp. NBRC 102530]GLY51421.1 hypothetical protein Lesp01_50770 [Lentzea sp. NBRC 102530]
MSTERQDPEHEYDEASRAPLDEADEDEAVPGRSGSGSVHPEPNPTGNVGISDYSAADDPDEG